MMEGPFAEKLKAATSGHAFPKGSPDASVVAGSFDLSSGGKPRRDKRREQHEERERKKKDDGVGISGSAVHTRGRFVDVPPAVSAAENGENQERHEKITTLVEEVNAIDERLQGLFREYPDVQLTLTEVSESGEKLDIDARIVASEAFATAGRDALAYEEMGGEISSENFDRLLANLSVSLNEMRDVEQQFREAANLPLRVETASGGETRSDKAVSLPADGEKNSGASESVEQTTSEQRNYASISDQELRAFWRQQSAEEKLDLIAGQIDQWRAFDRTIQQFQDRPRFEKDLTNRGLGDKYEQVFGLTRRSDDIARRLTGVRERLRETGSLNDKDAGFLKAIFFDYHQLLSVAERIVQERERETPIIAAEKEAREKKKREEEAVENGDTKNFETHLARVHELVRRWSELRAEFGARRLLEAIREMRGKEKLPVVRDIEHWLEERETPESWQGKRGIQNRETLLRHALPDMEGMVRDAEVAAIRLRAASQEFPSTAPVQTEGLVQERTERVVAERAPADIPADSVVHTLDTWLATYSGKRDTNKEVDQKIARSLKGALKDHTKLAEIMTHPGIGMKLPEGLHDLALASHAENPEALIRQRGQAFAEALAAFGNPTELSEADTDRVSTIIHAFSKECRDIKRALLPEVRMHELDERSRIFLSAYNDFFTLGDKVPSDDPESPAEKLKSRAHDIYGEFLAQKEKFSEYSHGTEADYRAFQSDLGDFTNELNDSVKELKEIMKQRPVALKTTPIATDVERQRTVTAGSSIETREFDRALTEANELVARWEALGEQVGFGPLQEGIHQLNKKGLKFPPISGLRKWLEEKKTSPNWSKDDQQELLYNVVPYLRQQLTWAETAVLQLSEKEVQQPAVVESVAAALTEWERLAPAERQAVNQKILGLRNAFVIELNDELKREGVANQGERKKIIEAVLAKYVRTTLQRKTAVGISFIESEIDALVVELTKEVTPT